MKRLHGTWLAAVSGGPDSMALLQMCLLSGTACAAAHVNYHHRPEAEEEEAYVRAFSKAHGLVCHVRNDPFTCEGNFEACAREYRYAFFAELVREYGYAGVLTAHHQDDLIETYLMQEEKGILPEYYGIKEDRMIHGVHVKRPLLGYTKQQLIDYCREQGIRTYTDSTNMDCSLTRNRIRHETVNTLTPFERTMILREIEIKNAVVQEQRCRVNTLIRNGKTELASYRAMEIEDRLTLLREMLGQKQVTFSRRGLLEIDRVLGMKEDVLIPCGGFQLATKSGRFFLAVPQKPYAYTVNTEEELYVLACDSFRVERSGSGVNAVTAREDDYPLTIRSVRNGDQIRMRFGRKSVHRFFIDRHIPRFDRLSWPVVVNRRNEVILVPGLGCDTDHYSISPSFYVLQYSTYE